MKKMRTQPDLDKLQQITEFVEQGLQEADCPTKIIFSINIAIDELYSNIVHYSQATGVDIEYEIKNDCIKLTFLDDGIPYDPTRYSEPNVTLSSDERKVGGLGIFMVKKSMDQMIYEYLDGKNVLTIVKEWQRN